MLKSGRAVKSTRVLQHIPFDSDQIADITGLRFRALAVSKRFAPETSG